MKALNKRMHFHVKKNPKANCIQKDGIKTHRNNNNDKRHVSIWMQQEKMKGGLATSHNELKL